MTRKPAHPTAFFMTDEARGTSPDHVANLPADAAVIFRDYDHPDRATLGRLYKDACQRRGLLFFVAGDQDLAIELGANGLHIPEHQIADISHLRNERWLVSAACHSSESLMSAAQNGADLALLSPIFPTKSHPDAMALGVDTLTDILDRSPIPIYALGGIDATTIKQLPDHPRLAGVAAIGYFMR